MIKIIVTGEVLEFRYKDYSKSMRQFLMSKLRNAARAFLKEAVLHVPVQTGMARGTFLNLGRILRMNKFVPIRPTRFGETYYPTGEPKDAATGSVHSFPAVKEQIFLDEGNKISFNFGNDVFHYVFNEFSGGSRTSSPTAPWKSYEKGKAAALFYLQNNFFDSRVPNLLDFTTVVTISNSSGTVQRTATKFRRPPAALREE